MAEVHAVELAHRDVARAGLDVGEPGDLHAGAEAYDGLEHAVLTRLGERDQAVAVDAAARCPRPSPGDRHPVAGLAGVVALEVTAGRKPSASLSGDDPSPDRRPPTSNGPIAVRRSSRQ